MPFEGKPVVLTPKQRFDLEEISRSQSLPAGFVLRAKIVLALAGGLAYDAVKEKFDTTAPTISRWKKRFLDHGLDGLETHRPGQPPSKLTPKMRAKILSATQRKPRDGSTHWSCRKLAQKLGVSKDLVHRVWREAGLRPHRLERYMASNDPDFERKAADIIGLYLDPPRHAAVFCVDEKTAIQALDRRDRVLPLSPGRAERHGFEYKRNGTLSLYAALDTKTGQVLGKTAAHHTSREFVDFLADVVASREPDSRDSPHLRQPLGAQDQARRRLSRRAPQRRLALHADLLVLAEPSRTLVLENPARRHRPRHLHLDRRSGKQAPPLHQRLLQERQAHQMEIFQPFTPHPPC